MRNALIALGIFVLGLLALPVLRPFFVDTPSTSTAIGPAAVRLPSDARAREAVANQAGRHEECAADPKCRELAIDVLETSRKRTEESDPKLATDKTIEACREFVPTALAGRETDAGRDDCVRAAAAAKEELSRTEAAITKNEEEQEAQKAVLNNPTADTAAKAAAEKRLAELEAENRRLQEQAREQRKKLELVATLMRLAALYCYATGNEVCAKALLLASAALLSGGDSGGGGGQGPGNQQRGKGGDLEAGSGQMSEAGSAKQNELRAANKNIIGSREGDGGLYLAMDEATLDVWNDNELLASVPLGRVTYALDPATGSPVAGAVNPKFLRRFNSETCVITFETEAPPPSNSFYLARTSVLLDGIDDCEAPVDWVMHRNTEIEFQTTPQP